MAHIQRTIELPPDQAGYVDAQVSGGLYASASEVVQAGLRALQAHNATLDEWLHEQVAPVIDRMRADPSRRIPAEDVFDALRAHHAAQPKEPHGV